MRLKEKLDAIRNGAEKRIPPEALAIMHRATEDLRKSGIAERIVKVSQKAPVFELPNQHDQPVSSQSLIAKGSLVVTFYRGVW